MEKEYYQTWIGFFEKLCVVAVTCFGAQIAFWGSYYVEHRQLNSNDVWLLVAGLIVNLVFGGSMMRYFRINVNKLKGLK